MEQRDLQVLAGFDAVWQRVMEGRAPETGAPGQGQETLELVYRAHRGYATLAQYSRGQIQRELRCLQKEARQAVRELQTAYFLRTGEVYHPAKTENFASCTMDNLRKMWKNACELRENLQGVLQDDGHPSQQAGRGCLPLLKAHPERLEQLIQSLF